MADVTLEPALARAVVVGRHVHYSDESAPVGKPRPFSDKREPTVELIREGILIRAVEIVCTCGERIRLRFDYE